MKRQVLPGMAMPGMRNMAEAEMPGRPKWESAVLSTLHCGAGCTLADLVGEWFMYFVPIAVGGSLLAGAWIADYILALVFGAGSDCGDPGHGTDTRTRHGPAAGG